MTTITRESFLTTMSPGLDPDKLGAPARAAAEAAGITPESLTEIAGGDGRISGRQELSRLFDLIDRVDGNGRRNSLATRDSRELPTLSGAAARALQDEIEKARVNRGAQGLGPAPTMSAYERAISKLEADGFTDIYLAPNTRYYNQGDKDFANVSYPKSPPVPGATRTLGEAGCAPFALAMADTALRGTRTSPIETARFAVDRGLSGAPKDFGTDTQGLAKAWAAARDLTLTVAKSRTQSENIDALVEGLRAGGVALISVGKGHFTDKGHVMLVNGYAKDAEGKEWFFVANPGRRIQENTDDSVKQDLSLNPALGAVRISRDQLAAELKYACILERRI